MLAVEKPILSKLLKPGNNRRIVNVDLHAGMVGTGLIPDCRQLANRAREEAFNHRETYDCNIPGPVLADRVSLYLQAYTLYSSVRPFGSISILGAVDRDGPHLYMMEPSGLYWGYRACASGKGRQIARSELEKLDLDTMTTAQAVKEAARMYSIPCLYFSYRFCSIFMSHDQAKDKEFELEISWIGPESGNKHQFVPKEVLEAAINDAKQFVLAQMEFE